MLIDRFSLHSSPHPLYPNLLMAELTLRQQQFVHALTTPNTPTFCKPSAAYRTISPDIVPGAQHVGAFRMIRNDNVQAAVKGQLGLPQLGSKLKKCLRETEKLKDWPQVRETVMDYARLTGQLVEKREVRTTEAVTPLVRRLLLVVAADEPPPRLTDAKQTVMRRTEGRLSDAKPSATMESPTDPPHPTAEPT